MAGELQADYLTGKTVYFLVRNSVGQIWNTNSSAFEAYTTANLANYSITGTEQGTASGYYVGTMVAATLGSYAIVAKKQAGGTPAETDTTVGAGNLEWDGTAVISRAGLFTEDIGGTIENAAAVHSLATALLKLVSKFDLGSAETTAQTFQTDGHTVKMSQAITKKSGLTPVQTLGVGF